MSAATTLDLASEVADAHGARSLVAADNIEVAFSSGGSPSPRRDNPTHWLVSRPD